MVAKGAWLNRPVILRQARQTNDADVRKAKVEALGRALEIEVMKGPNFPTKYIRAILEVPA